LLKRFCLFSLPSHSLDAIGGPNHLGNMCDAPLLAVPYRAGRSGKHNISSLPNFEHSYYPFGPVVGDSQTKEELHARGVPAEYLERGVVVQPMFYYMGHISRHVRPGKWDFGSFKCKYGTLNTDTIPMLMIHGLRLEKLVRTSRRKWTRT
jgi:hypothetical protein